MSHRAIQEKLKPQTMNTSRALFKRTRSFLKKLTLSSILNKFRILLRRRHPLQKTKPRPGLNFVKLGSNYGGWTLIDTNELHSSTIVSAGLGEDASFDIEFANRYGAKVVVVDPTPRAVAHFNEILSHAGFPSSTKYVEGGKQPIDAYELLDINSNCFTLVERALWNESTKLRFYLPKNLDHVSHSISNVANDYRKDTDYIEVHSITLSSLLSTLSIPNEAISLIKLDIEGAEIEVIAHFISEDIFPMQILVEFDDLAKPTKYAFERVDRTNTLLKKNGYTCVHSDGARNFLFVQLEKLSTHTGIDYILS